MNMASELDRRLSMAATLLRDHNFQCWSYGDSIGFEGLLAAAEQLGRSDLSHFVHGYLRGWSARREPFTEIDNTAPGHAGCLVYEQTGDALVIQGLERLAHWLCRRPRIGSVFVTFARSCLRQPYGPTLLAADEAILVNDPGPGIYLDCLHFDPPFFAHLARLIGSTSLRDEAVTQAQGYIDLLYDRDTHLFHHFYLERTRRAHISGWGRGQGWAVLGLLDLIEQLDPADPNREGLLDTCRQLAAAMLDLQRSDGHWYTMVDDPTSGDETSTAAFMAAAFWKGIQLGVLSPETYAQPAERAWQATLNQLDTDGMLHGVSAAVESSTATGHYHHVPKDFLVPWGQGPLLLAASRRPAESASHDGTSL
jgi:unsaturated rhamnogalacturonyl hydrolase